MKPPTLRIFTVQSSKISSIVFVLLLLPAVGPVRARAQDEQLKGLTGVRVNILITPEPNTVLEKDSLETNRVAIQTDVELRLRQAGMRILNESEQRRTPGAPELQVVITSRPDTATYESLKLIEEVLLARDPKVRFRTAIWERAGLAAGQYADVKAVREFIKDMADQLLNAWLAVNPKSR